MASISDALAIAIQHHQSGRLQSAEQIYRQILRADPNHADAIHLLGLIAHQVGQDEVAVEYIGRAIGLKGNVADFHTNLAKVYQALHRLPEAIASCHRALELKPDFAGAHNNLGNIFRDQGKSAEAIACFRRAVELAPDFAEAHNNLGNAFRDQGKPKEATACFRRALELKSDFAGAHSNLGNALRDFGKPDEAVMEFRRALELAPDLAEAHNNLANALKDQGKLDEAVACYRRAVELAPQLVEAHNNLGNAFRAQGRLPEALACYHRALALNPCCAEVHNHLGDALKEQGKLDKAVVCFRRALELDSALAEAHNNLGNALKDAGLLDEAIASYGRGLALAPHNDVIHSNLVHTLPYHPAHDDASIHEELRRWNRQFAEPLRKCIQPHLNERDPERTLRLGYVSPHFRDHVVGRNILPILERHDQARFQVFCYASVAQPDAFTQRFQRAADVWRNVGSASDPAVADLIRADGIDILVDLSLHTAGQRLGVFARKPAPVQVTWAGYPGTTGLDAIDYRLTDPYLDPQGTAEEYSSEEPIRLPHSFWCYDPLTDSLPVNPLPALSAGRVTFGSLNNYCKVNEGVIDLWSQVLCAVKGSRLLLLSKEGAHRERAREQFERSGVAADRLEWFTPAARPEYLAAYHRIDLGLDTFPYNGHTTSLDSAWMGVPVVTLVGPTIVGRAGLSQLMNLGLPELIAYSPEQYIKIAAELAQDLPRLSWLRATMRERMQASPLMDTPRFTQNIEAIYRKIWRRWCAQNTHQP